MANINKLIILLTFIGFPFGLSYAQTTIIEESLLTQSSFDTFTGVSVTGTQNWYFNEQYGAVCSGYAAGQSSQNEDWFISPNMNLSEASNVQLTFMHTRGNAAVMNVGVTEGWYKVFATANYSGDPTTTQWIELSGLNQNITTAWQYVSSGEISIPETVRSQYSRIAFRYISSATQSATWEIKNVKVTADSPNTNPGSDGNFKITNWNTEWLGCTTEGPANETLQVNNVASIMRSLNSDVYCLQEISNTDVNPSIERLVSVLGSDQWGGAIVPVNTGECTQRQGIIYKKSKVQLVSSFEMSTGNRAQGNSYSYNWSGGRYPAVYNVNFVSGNNLIPVSLVNIHAKAEDGNAMSYTRRKGAAEALKVTLDSGAYEGKNVVIIGDFNDYLNGTTSSSCQCTDSPYKNFIDDTARYAGITNWNANPIIENIIISDELLDNYMINSVKRETAVAQTIFNYYNTTSNHFPVSASFQFSTLSTIENSGNQEDLWAVYPNPVNNLLHVTGRHSINTTAEIYDLTGRKLFSGKLNNDAVDVNILPAAVYILKIGDNSKKFVKNK